MMAARPGLRALPDWSAVPSNSEEDRILLNKRLAFFGRVIFTLSMGFFLITFLVHVAMGDSLLDYLSSRPVLFDLGATGVFGVASILCRSGRRSPAELNAIDIAGLVAGVGLFGLMCGAEMTDLANQSLFVQVSITLAVVVTRAVIVPGTARRTFRLSAAAAMPLVLLACYSSMRLPVQMKAAHPMTGVATITYVSTWAALIVAVATLTSRVIYGLQERVRAVTQLGQYTLEEKLGEGGMGLVYKARHALLRRPTAVKLLPAEMAGERSVKRFEREVQLTSSLTHPNTIAIYDYGHTPDGTFYYAMEYLEGLTLEDLITYDGPQPAARVIHILRQVCGALAEAHGIGLIHRDIKPANLMLCARGGIPDCVKVLDFGLVKETSHDEGTEVTNDGTLLGTPAFLAPEAIGNCEAIDARADIYALGAAYYQLLAGVPVFQAATVIEMCAAHLHKVPEPPSERSGQRIPAYLEELVLACLAKDPNARPSSVGEILEVLDRRSDGAWSMADARRWWGERAEKVMRLAHAERQASGVKSGPRTVAIDFVKRAAGV
jgi:eukaryotic-like serine/threonine-protein kinase